MKYLSRLALALILTTPALPSSAAAGLSCTWPLWVHEWGVHVFDGGGSPIASGLIPDFFYRDGPSRPRPTAVRDMPRDNGLRELPVIHFYSPATAAVPVGVEVGFTQGAATTWYPDVDLRRPAGAIAGPLSKSSWAMLTGRQDSNRELVWDRLELTATPTSPAALTQSPWITQARAIPQARWVNRANESERFVFYEGSTSEEVPLTITRSARYSAKARSYVVTNAGKHPIHDVMIIHREGPIARLVTIRSLAAAASAPFTIDGPHQPKLVEKATAYLRDALVDPKMPTPPDPNALPAGSCGIHDNPGIPFDTAADHRIYRGEVELILDTWRPRFFEADGTTIIYREDAATIAEAMPLSIYTDTQSYAVIHRAGLALWQNVLLP